MKEFTRAALIRAIKTMCQTAVAVIGTAAVIDAIDWKMVISSSIVAGLVSILTSIATGLPEVGMTDDAEDDIDYLDYLDEVEDYEE